MRLQLNSYHKNRIKYIYNLQDDTGRSNKKHKKKKKIKEKFPEMWKEARWNGRMWGGRVLTRIRKYSFSNPMREPDENSLYNWYNWFYHLFMHLNAHLLQYIHFAVLLVLEIVWIYIPYTTIYSILGISAHRCIYVLCMYSRRERYHPPLS